MSRPAPYTPRQYVSPYAKQLLGIQAELDAQNAVAEGPMYTPEQLQSRRNENLYDRELGLLSKLSGDAPLASFGDKLLTRSLAQQGRKYTEHGEFDPETGTLTRFPGYMKQRELDRIRREQDKTEREDLLSRSKWESDEARRAAAADLASYKWEGGQAGRDIAAAKETQRRELAEDGKPLTSGQMYKDLSSLGQDVTVMKELKDAAKKYEGPALGISKLGTFQDYVTREAGFAATNQMKADQQAWAAVLRLKEMKERYKLFGATLTTNELGSWNAVTPPRGSSAAELKTWMDKQAGLMDRALAWTANNAVAAGASKKQVEAMSHGLYKAPKAKETPPAAPPAAAPVSAALEDGAPAARFVPGRGIVFAGDGDNG